MNPTQLRHRETSAVVVQNKSRPLVHHIRHFPGHALFYLPCAVNEKCYPLARYLLLPTCPVRTLYQGTTKVVPDTKHEFFCSIFRSLFSWASFNRSSAIWSPFAQQS